MNEEQKRGFDLPLDACAYRIEWIIRVDIAHSASVRSVAEGIIQRAYRTQVSEHRGARLVERHADMQRPVSLI